MFGGLNRLLVVAFVAGAILAAPSGALAGGCGGNASAVNVYRECLPSGGGGGGGGGHAGHAGGQSGGSTSPPISSQAAKALKQAGKDRRKLFALVRSAPDSGFLQSNQGSESTPSAVGSAFDLGSGPTALLLALAAAAALLLGASGVRGWRRSHHRA
jgi:hypothetical protein